MKSSRLRNKIVYDCVYDFLHVFFEFVFVHANHTLVRSSLEVVRSQVFTRLRVLKERSTVQVVDVKVKAINIACRTAE